MNGSVFLIMVLFLVFFLTKTPKQLMRKRAYDFLLFTLGVYGERVYAYFIFLANKYEYEMGNFSFLILSFIVILLMQDRD